MGAALAGSPEALAAARRRLVSRRLPYFAAGWLGSIALWAGVGAAQAPATLLPAVALLLVQAGALAGALAVCRRDPAAPRVGPVVLGACLLLGLSSIALFAAAGGRAHVLAFVLLTLYLMAALAFSWGWRAELGLVAGTMPFWAASLPRLELVVSPLELAAAIAIGWVVCLAVAEGAARTFGLAFLRRASEEEARRALADSRNAYRDLAEHARDFIWTMDLEGRLTYANAAAARFLGEPAEALVGRAAADFLTDHPDNPDVRALIARLAAGEVPPPIPVQVEGVRGPRWIEQVIAAVHDAGGRMVGVRGIGRDVHERRLAEEELRRSEERFRIAVKCTSLGLALFGPDLRPIQVNDAFCRMLGYEEAELLALSMADITHPDDRQRSLDLTRRLVAGTLERIEVEKRYLHKGGRVVWGQLSASLVRGPAGAPQCFIAQVQDVTERKRAEEALRASEARYRGLVESQAQILLRYDLEGRVTFANDFVCALLGRPREKLLGASLLPLIHEEDREAVLAAMAALRVPPYRTQIRSRGITRGGWRWFEWEGAAVLDGEGRPVEFQAVGRDVTERRCAEEALRESEARYRGLVESQQDLVARCDPQGRLTFANDAYCARLGLDRDRVLGTSLTALVHLDDLPAVRAAIRRLEEPPHRGVIQNRARTPEGWRWFEWEQCAVRDERGVTREIQGVGRDVTERRASEEALRASLEELRRSEEQLRMLAQHQVQVREEERKRLGLDIHDDVCQELVGISILVESLRRRLGPLAADYAADFDRVGRYLNELVEHLRLLARELRPMQLRDLGLEGSLRSLAAGMSSAATSVVALFPTPIPRLGEEMEMAVYRVAQEALANAVRHAAARSIVLRLAAARGRLRLEVRDDGRGFDPGNRTSASLGLVSMQERALALGGHLELRSAPGDGTLVRLECPIAVPTPASAA